MWQNGIGHYYIPVVKYCFSKEMAHELEKSHCDLVCNTMYDGKEAWVFINNNKIKFSKEELGKTVLYTNRLYF